MNDEEYNIKIPEYSGIFVLAGAEGLEPSRTVLETAMLPLHHAPKTLEYYNTYY